MMDQLEALVEAEEYLAASRASHVQAMRTVTDINQANDGLNNRIRHLQSELSILQARHEADMKVGATL